MVKLTYNTEKEVTSMQTKEREKLREAAQNHAYTSIAINKDGAPIHGIFIPWEKTATAMNMKMPRITITVEDLKNEEIIKKLQQCHLIGCYILTPLDDYQFISQFHELWDLFILYGEKVHDLSFIQNMPKLFLFYLEDAKLKDIKPLIDNCKLGNSLPGKSFGFYHCEIEDTSAMQEADFIISELLIWPKKGKTDSKDRWKRQNGRYFGTFRIYE